MGTPDLVVDQDQQYKITLKIEGKADRTDKVYKFICPIFCLVEILGKQICKFHLSIYMIAVDSLLSATSIRRTPPEANAQCVHDTSLLLFDRDQKGSLSYIQKNILIGRHYERGL